MRRLLFVGPLFCGLILACSSGRSQPKTTPPKKQLNYTIRDLFLTLGKQKFEIRPGNGETPFVFDFSKFARLKVVNIVHVGDDFVRIQNGSVQWNVPFHAINLIATD